MSEILHINMEGGAGRELADMEIAMNMAAVLDRHYPGHIWAINVQSLQGVATVKNLRLSGCWGFVLRLGATYSGSDWDRRVMLAGGELLEHYRVSRTRFGEKEYGDLRIKTLNQHGVSL